MGLFRSQLQQPGLEAGQFRGWNVLGLIDHGLRVPVADAPGFQGVQGGGVGGAEGSGLAHEHHRGVRGHVQDRCCFLGGEAEREAGIEQAGVLQVFVPEQDLHPGEGFGLLGLGPPDEVIEAGEHGPGVVLGQGLGAVQG